MNEYFRLKRKLHELAEGQLNVEAITGHNKQKCVILHLTLNLLY